MKNNEENQKNEELKELETSVEKNFPIHPKHHHLHMKQLLKTSLKKGVGGGIGGFTAMSVQVVSLMWLRTTINNQYIYGENFLPTLRNLYNEGGVKRMYRGFFFALIQASMVRFGDTFSNQATFEFFKDNANMPIIMKTGIATFFSSLFRIGLMPVDAMKTCSQTTGRSILYERIRDRGFRAFYSGSTAVFFSSIVSFFPWFFTFNTLYEKLPPFNNIVRNGVIGFCSSTVAATFSNTFKVLKVYKQAFYTDHTYRAVVQTVQKTDGFGGIFFRGLKTKICVSGLQGILFSICWKYIEERIFEKKEKKEIEI